MENDPLVSVVIATYNRFESLNNAICSVIEQTYDNIEIIVVDDNANEKNNLKIQEIIKSIRTERIIKYIQNSVNKGSAEARNIGIRAANGTYITFLDDDDIYLKNKVKNQVNFMIKKVLDYSITDLSLYNENDTLVEYRNRKYIKSFLPDDLLKYHLMYHISGTDAIMSKRDYLISIGGFPPIDIGDEFYLIERAIDYKGRFGYLPKCDLKAYVHTDNKGLSSGDNKILGENQLYDYKKNFFERLNVKEVKYIKMRHYAVLAYAEIRQKHYFDFIKYSLLSFLISNIDFLKLVIYRK